MAKIAVLIGASERWRLLASPCELEMALMAESVLNGIALVALPVLIWIHWSNDTVVHRLTDYLAGVREEFTITDAP